MTKIRRSKLQDHTRHKKVLSSKLAELNMSQVFWHRSLLPEFLWIDSLISTYGLTLGVEYYNAFLDLMDQYDSAKDLVFMGTVSCFRQIKTSGRKDIIDSNEELIDHAVIKPFGQIINLYPEIPMKWFLDNNKMVFNKNEAIKQVRDAIIRLFPAKDDHGGLCRALPLNRYFKHNKIKISSKMEDTIKAIETYPHGDRYRAEAFARTVINMDLMRRVEDKPAYGKWSKYFWQYNYEISNCE